MGTGKYLVRSVIVLLVAGLGGCMHVPVTMESLEWQPAVLSKEGCPDLTGVYQDRGTLKRAFFAGLTTGGRDAIDPTGQPISVRSILKSPVRNGAPAEEFYVVTRAFNERAMLAIRQGQKVLEATLMDAHYEVYERIVMNLDSPAIGCHEGALVVRWKSVNRRAEWGGGDVSWGEREIRKLADGSLQVTSRMRIQALSILTGAPTGPVRTRPEYGHPDYVAIYPTVTGHGSR